MPPGALTGALTTQYFHTDLFTSVTILVLSTLASLLPDICHTQSKIGRRFRVLSFVIRLLFGHIGHLLTLLLSSLSLVFTVLNSNTHVLYGCNCYWNSFTCYTRYINT